jgi:glycosyltransferase involved in cell wall biosynthesis
LSFLEEFAKQVSNVKIFNDKENKGLTKRLIQLIENASGTYIARQDVGDISCPDRIEKQSDFLSRNVEIGLVGCAFNVFDELGELYTTWEPNDPDYLAKKIRLKNFFAHGSLMFRKSLYNQMGGYNLSFRMAQDYELILNFASRSKLGYLPAVLYFNRFNISGLSISASEEQSKWAAIARGETLNSSSTTPSIEKTYRMAGVRGGHLVLLFNPAMRKIKWVNMIDKLISTLLFPMLKSFEKIYKTMLLNYGD